MTAIKTLVGLLAVSAVALVPSAAAVSPIVPPGNSAAAQYTEAIPTGSGDKKTGPGGGVGHRSPSKVLGAKNTRRLDSHGPQGRVAAEVAAVTAPTAIATSGPSGGDQVGQGHSAGGADGGSVSTAGEEPIGSSGLSEVIGQATGSSSSGELGWFLPLAIVGAILWSLLYLLRHRRQAD